jgi:hypothetical protein
MVAEKADSLDALEGKRFQRVTASVDNTTGNYERGMCIKG